MKSILIKPYLNEFVDVNRSIFLKHYYPARYKSTSKGSPFSYGNNRTLKDTLKSTVGESIERSHLYHYSGDNQLVNAFNIINGKTIEVEIKDFLLNLDLNILENDYPLYSDTCGVATHLNSSKAIENALYEFIERQSLIMTWISKIPGRVIPLKYIDNYMNLKYLDGYRFHVCDISIWDSFKVALVIGINDYSKRFVVGCCAHKDLFKAVEGAMSEASMIAHFYESDNASNIGSNKVDPQTTEESNSYANYFYSLTFEEMKNSYKFIMESSTFIEDKVISEDIRREDIESLGLDIYCLMIPTRNNKKFKTVKIFSPDAFPHMDTSRITPSLYKIVKVLNYKDFPNIYKPIPFP